MRTTKRIKEILLLIPFNYHQSHLVFSLSEQRPHKRGSFWRFSNCGWFEVPWVPSEPFINLIISSPCGWQYLCSALPKHHSVTGLKEITKRSHSIFFISSQRSTQQSVSQLISIMTAIDHPLPRNHQPRVFNPKNPESDTLTSWKNALCSSCSRPIRCGGGRVWIC